jgi:poly-gamma-glutamate capsule biosynthesis protein CapA/YwtB (metallophosphatase superfamily)
MESAKIGDPTLTEAKFFKKYIKQPNGNILDNIDNKATTDRMVKRLQKDVGVLSGRVDRLGEYRKDITVKRVDSTIKDVGVMVNANKTVEKNIQNQIKDNNWLLKRRDLTPAERKSIKDNNKTLDTQLKGVKTSNKVLSKQYSKFANTYTGLSENELKKAYTKLLDNVEKDIVNKQQPLVFEQTLNASASSPMKRTAQTQYVLEVTNEDLEKFNAEQDESGETLYVQWTLSPSHNIVDICDDHAEADVGFGAGIYPLDDAPVPIVDSHPNCKCRLVKVDI